MFHIRKGYRWILNVQKPKRTIATIQNEHGKTIGILNMPRLVGGEEIDRYAREFVKDYPELLEERQELK